MSDDGRMEPASVREGSGGSSGAPVGANGRRRLPGGLAGRRYLLAIAVLVTLATIPTLAVTQAGSHALRGPSNSAADSAPFITGSTDPAIVVASPPFAVGDPVEVPAPPPGERPTEIGVCPGERADGFCVARPGVGQDGEEGDTPMPDPTRPLGGRYVIT